MVARRPHREVAADDRHVALEALPRFAFFTGKGGVGKTSLACAAAVRLTGQGTRVLLVSADRASNVGQGFDLTVGNTVASVPGLDDLETDPQQAAEAYRVLDNPGVIA
ncbi:ArsA-related P-loop ATPase [Terrabacter terrae]|uniref:ArsA-related P-loop ATPase n=1 Tax=Terrabacter terrae TaxID=318434 RepID=UPI0031D6BE6C